MVRGPRLADKWRRVPTSTKLVLTMIAITVAGLVLLVGWANWLARP